MFVTFAFDYYILGILITAINTTVIDCRHIL